MRRQFYVRDKIEGICSRCKSGIATEFASGRIVVHCTYFDKRLSEPVEHCSKFTDIDVPSIELLEQSATILLQDKMGKIGFIRPGTEEHKQFVKTSSYDDPF